MPDVDVDRLLMRLSAEGISASLIERNLELPVGTLDRWRDEPSVEGVALLRLVAALPWLLDVAEYKFDPAVTQYLLLERAARVLAAGIGDSEPTEIEPTARVPHIGL